MESISYLNLLDQLIVILINPHNLVTFLYRGLDHIL